MKKWLVMALIFTLGGCSSHSPELASKHPKFDPIDYFSGELMAYGMVTGFSDELTRRFEVKLKGKVDGSLLILDEYFTFDDGEKQFRQWRIKKTGTNQYRGEADDIIGTAIGQTLGPLMTWQYQMDLEVDGSTYRVSFDDDMVMLDEKRMLNRAKIMKLGMNVANVIIFFEKLD